MSNSVLKFGAQWLGQLPDGWDQLRARYLFTERKEKSTKNDTHLTPSQKYAVLPQDEYMKRTGKRVVLNLTGSDNMKHVEEGDFVIHLRSFQGGIEYSGYTGKVSNAYTVLEPKDNVDSGFFKHVLKSHGFISELSRTTDQLRDGQSIKFSQLDLLEFPSPKPITQQKIADFLDQETAKIDNLIAKQERLLELLEEKRRATITHAVTRGLDSHAELKETNIPWLGKVPEHWKVVRISRIFAENKDSNNDLGSLEPMKYKFGTIVPKNVKITEETQDELRRYNLIQPDDIMINGLNLNYDFVTQRVAVVEHYGCMTPAYISIRKRNSDVITGYYTYLLKALDSQKVLNGWGTGIRLTLNYSELKKKEVLYPPIAEQSSIVEFLDSYIKKTSVLESKIQTQIKLLKERRTSLISHAVTGKIKV